MFSTPCEAEEQQPYIDYPGARDRQRKDPGCGSEQNLSFPRDIGGMRRLYWCAMRATCNESDLYGLFSAEGIITRPARQSAALHGNIVCIASVECTGCIQC